MLNQISGSYPERQAPIPKDRLLSRKTSPALRQSPFVRASVTAKKCSKSGTWDDVFGLRSFPFVMSLLPTLPLALLLFLPLSHELGQGRVLNRFLLESIRT